MRLFAASLLPETLSEKIYEVSQAAARRFGAKAVAPENMHITYKYFGDKDTETCLEIVGNAVKNAESADISVKGAGFFSRGGYAGVLWAGICDESGVLSTIAANMGVSKESFMAHITMARFKNKGIKNAVLEKYISENSLKEKEFGFFALKSVCLMESFTGPCGAEYKVLEEFCLGK